MAKIARYTKAPLERKRYQIDYTDWLDTAELVSSVAASVVLNTAATPLVVDTVTPLPSNLGVQYFVSGGVDGVTYEILFLMTTNQSQIREDAVMVAVREP